jgi:hypothetical protein
LKGLSAVTDDLLTGGPAGTVAAKITADLSGVVAATPNLQGLPVAIASVVQALATDVQSILTTYGTQTIQMSADKLLIGVPPTLGKGEVHFGTHDRQRLIALRAKALGLLADSDVRLQMLKK